MVGVPHVRPARANVGFLGSVPDVLWRVAQTESPKTNVGAPHVGLTCGVFDFPDRPIPLQPQESPFNTLIQPFPEYLLGYRHPHATIPRVTSNHPRHSRRPSAVWSLIRSLRFHTDDWPDRLQISYAMDPNGRVYPLSFQSLIHPSSPSSSHGTLRIPFVVLPLRTSSFTTGGYTPLLPLS